MSVTGFSWASRFTGLALQSSYHSRPCLSRFHNSLRTRPFVEEEGSGHVPTFELSPRNGIMYR